MLLVPPESAVIYKFVLNEILRSYSLLVRTNSTCIFFHVQTCKPYSAGTMCRTAERECDLPEYCTGLSEYCPEDVYKVDGEPCNKGLVRVT